MLRTIFRLALLLCSAILFLRLVEGREGRRESLECPEGTNILKTCACDDPADGFGVCWDKVCDLCFRRLGKRSLKERTDTMLPLKLFRRSRSISPELYGYRDLSRTQHYIRILRRRERPPSRTRPPRRTTTNRPQTTTRNPCQSLCTPVYVNDILRCQCPWNEK